MDRRALATSPQEVDPLSWFSGPLIPGVFAGVIVVYGLIETIAVGRSGPALWLELVAILAIAGACFSIQVLTRPHRPQLRTWQAVVVLVLAAAGLLASAVDLAPSSLPVEQWWAPTGMALVVAALGPYSSTWQILGYGLSASVVAAAASFGFVSTERFWAPLSVVLAGASPVLIAIAATTVFSYTVVRDILHSLDRQDEPAVPPEGLERLALEGLESGKLPDLVNRVTPFLERLAESGAVTPNDRALAGHLARSLRVDLVTHVELSWLDSIAEDRPITVVDPEHRADSMRPAQRAALRGLLLAVLKSPVLDRETLLVELRGHPDGSTAVALSMDLDLPEGRRIMMLAPYYLTLKTTVHNLTWDDGRHLSMRFQLPPGNGKR